MSDLDTYRDKLEEWVKLTTALHLIKELQPCQERADISTLLYKVILPREMELRRMEQKIIQVEGKGQY